MTPTTFAAPQGSRLSRRAALVRLISVAAMLGATACGGDSATTPTTSIAGVYSLEKVSRMAVPVQVYEGPFYHDDDQRSYEEFVVIMTGGSLELTAQGTYRTTLDYRAIKDGVEEIGSLRARGVYTVEDDEIFFARDNGADAGTGTVERGTVVVPLDVVGKGVLKPYTFAR